MSNRDARRHHRMPYIGPVVISWQDANGETKYAQAKCLDISEGGLRIETPGSVSVRTYLSLRADRIKLAGSATVKHVVRNGSKYTLGLELSQALREQVLAVVREPWTFRKPVSVA